MATTNTRVISCVTSKSRTSVCGLMGKGLRISLLFLCRERAKGEKATKGSERILRILMKLKRLMRLRTGFH